MLTAVNGITESDFNVVFFHYFYADIVFLWPGKFITKKCPQKVECQTPLKSTTTINQKKWFVSIEIIYIYVRTNNADK